MEFLLWIYRALLRIYPREFRAQFGAEMEHAFAVRCAGARATGVWSLACAAIHGFGDLIQTGVAERLDSLRTGATGLYIGLTSDARIAVRSSMKSPVTTLAILTTF